MGRPKGAKNKPKGESGDNGQQKLLTEGGERYHKQQGIATPDKTEGGGAPPENKVPEVDLFSDDIPVVESPLAPPVVEKNYTAIPDTPQGEVKKDKPKDTKAPAGEFKESTTPAAPTTPPLTPEEIKTQAAQSVAMFWKFYSKLHTLGRHLARINKDELISAHLEGKLDINQEIPFGDKQVKLIEFVDGINASIDKNIVVSKELETSLSPAMIRVCIKRGWLISDEAYIAWTLLEDISSKVGIAAGLKSSFKLILDTCVKMTDNQKQILKNQEDERKAREKLNNNGQEKSNTDTPTAKADEWVEKTETPEAKSNEAVITRQDGTTEVVEVQ